MAGTRKRNALSLSRSPNIDTSEGNAGQPSRKNPRSRRGKLAILMEMPIEIFLEVSRFLLPFDIMLLSRTCKSIRKMLMTKRAHWIWKSAFHNERQLPECPDHMTEPQYASFLFDAVCSTKGCQMRAQNADFRLMLRMCKAHKEEQTVDDIDIFAAIRPWADVLGTESISSLMGPSSARDYWALKSDLHSLVEGLTEKCAVDGATPRWVRQTNANLFIKQWKAWIAEKCKRADSLEAWSKSRRTRPSREQASTELEAARVESINERLSELGWEAEDLESAEADEEYQLLLFQPTRLTNSKWKRIYPRLEAILRELRENRSNETGET